LNNTRVLVDSKDFTISSIPILRANGREMGKLPNGCVKEFETSSNPANQLAAVSSMVYLTQTVN